MKNYVLAAAAAFSIALPSVSQAATQVNITGYSFANGSKDGTLHLATSPFNNATVSIGEFKLTGNTIPGNSPLTIFSYCIDLGHGLGVPAIFNVEALSTMFTGTKATNLTKLLANTNAMTSADASAAIQMAVWEIAFETNATLSVSSDSFFVNGGTSAAAIATANSYLSQLGSWTVPTGGYAYLLTSQGNQTQIAYAVTAVPESATWTMMITGFGIAGASLRVRRRKAATALA